MVLSRNEFQACESDQNEKVISLFELRQSTNSFLIQCLADREIQLIQHNQQKGASKAYRYNCAVVHSPHSYCQFTAVQGHGWDSVHERTIDPKLRLGKVLYSGQNRNMNDIGRNTHDATNLQETIDILKEENSNLKAIYAVQLKKYGELLLSRPEPSSSVDSQLREMRNENASLKQQIQSKDVQITNLHTQVNNMRAQINRTATESNRNSVSGRTVNETLIMSLIDQNEAYKSQIAFQDAEIRNLTSQVNHLRAQNLPPDNRRREARESDVQCCIIS